MSNKPYGVFITQEGMIKLVEAEMNDKPLGLTVMAVGDGGGSLPPIDQERGSLINEKYRSKVNRVDISRENPNVIESELIIPAEIGGFWLREVALFDDEGICIALGNMPETYKPLLAEGSGRYQVVRVQLLFSNTAIVKLISDPSIVIATSASVKEAEDAAKDYADSQISQHEQSRNHPDATLISRGFTKLNSATNSDDETTSATPKAVKEAENAAKDYTAKQLKSHEESRNHPDATLTEKGLTQLSNKIDSNSETLAATPAAIKAAIAAAVRQAWELSNPKGISLFFFENVNPNTLWPWSTWEYTGEDRTVRIAKQDGSNVGKFGGSDTVTITRSNLPNERLAISGSTSQQAAQTIATKPAGKHKHKGGMSGPGDSWDPDYVVGSDNDSHRTRNYTSDDGDHSHDMDVPAHAHDVSGATEALGQGQAISIVEKHVLQMCWHRVA